MRSLLHHLFGFPAAPPPEPAVLDDSGFSLSQRFAWHLVRRSRSQRFVDFSPLDSAELSVWHCAWPGDADSPCILPDAPPSLSLSRQACKPSRLESALRRVPIAQSVVRISGLDRFPISAPSIDFLRRLSLTARYLLLETNAPSPAFDALCRDLAIPPAFVGNALALSGREASPPPADATPAKALALMTTYNEADVVEQCVEHLFAQGLDVFVVDDNSTDGTLDKLESIARSTPRLFLDKDTRKNARFYDRGILFSTLLAHANRAAANGCEWMMNVDADEIRSSPWPGVPLAAAFARVAALGYNAVDFTVADFRYIKGQRMTSAPFESQMPLFEFGRRHGHFIQIKAWRHAPGLDVALEPSGGHDAHFAGRRVFPLKFLLKHYPLRGLEHARQKIFRDRFPRYHPDSLANGAHVQYNVYRDREPEGWDPADLLRWDDRFHSRYLLERLSGIGLDRPS